MTQYKVGDKVKLTKGEDAIEGKLRDAAGFLWVGAASTEPLTGLLASGWKLEVIEKAPPVYTLPEEDGFYLDHDNELWQRESGNWEFPGDPGGVTDPEKYLPMTRLVPEPQAQQVHKDVMAQVSVAIEAARSEITEAKRGLPGVAQLIYDQQLSGIKLFRKHLLQPVREPRDGQEPNLFTAAYDGQF